ncbi:MAG: SRPBCC family protein [Pyrinomonadaceae bacterium]
MSKNDLKIEARGDTELVISRTFDAPVEMVFDAHTKPEIVRQWLLGPDGWTMPVCEIDLRIGGKYRYVWKKENTGDEMGMGGEFREVEEPNKYVATEKFDQSWYPGGAVSTTTFADVHGKTAFQNVMKYDSKEAREAVLASPMDEGLSVGYDRLEALLNSQAQTAGRGD